MDMQHLMPWLLGITTIINLLTTVYNLITTSSKKNSQAIDKISTAVNEQASRIQSIELEMRHLPTAQSINDLQLRLADHGAKLGRMEESFINQQRTVNRVEEYLLKGATAA